MGHEDMTERVRLSSYVNGIYLVTLL